MENKFSKNFGKTKQVAKSPSAIKHDKYADKAEAAAKAKTVRAKQGVKPKQEHYTPEDDYSVDLSKMQRILAKFKPSAEPKCPIYAECGGCQLQQLSYEEQLRFKRNVVVEDMKVIGGLANTAILPVLGAENPWNYRNKTQMPLGYEKGKVVLGCYAQGTHKIIDTVDCCIQQEYQNRQSSFHFLHFPDLQKLIDLAKFLLQSLSLVIVSTLSNLVVFSFQRL